MEPDINYIIQQSLKGDKNSQEILIERLKPLIYKNIYKYWNPGDLVVEDMVQEGYIVILKSLSSFDKNRNVHYLYYIKTKLVYFYKNQNKKTKNSRNEISLYKHIDEGIPSLEETIKSSLNLLEDAIAKEEKYELMKSIKSLTVQEQEIIYSYYFLEQPMIAISKVLNIKYQTALLKKRSALKKLKKYMYSRG